MSALLLAIEVYGLAIVISFVVAALIKGVVVALPLLERRADSARLEVPPPAPAAIPPEHVAAIGAAVATMLPGHDILHIEDRARAAIWTAEGRMMHQTSHAVPRDRRR